MPIRNFDDVELRFADVEEKFAVQFAETTANLNAIQNDYYAGIPTLATIQYVDDTVSKYGQYSAVEVSQDLDDRISALEKSMRDIKTLLMELVEKDIVSGWEAVVRDCLS